MARNWTDEQIRVIEQKNSNLLVAAAAGSGKTAVMVERIIRRVLDEDNPMDIDRIVVVTFTKAAATQMRERIGAALASVLASEHNESRVRRLRSQLALLDNAVICTIDSFCNYILRNYFNTIDLDPSYRIGDEGELTLMMSDAADEVIEEAYAEKNPAFIEFVEGQLPAKSDKNLSEWIISLYTFSQSHPYPERWLTECMEWYKISSVEEFNNSAVVKFIVAHVKSLIQASVEEHKKVIAMLEAPGGIEKYISAFSRDCEMLERVCEAESYDELRDKLDFNFEKLASAPKGSDEELKKTAQDTRKRLKSRIDKVRSELLAWSAEQNVNMIQCMSAPTTAFIELVLRFTGRYAEVKSENNILSFSDVEHLALKVLRSDEGITHAAEELQSLYEEIYIDEYQDSNMVQELILTAVSRGNNIFMVGDIKQSIYSFRQADPGIFLEKYNTYEMRPDAGNVLICLHRNFRSRANVLNAVNDIFVPIMHAGLGGVEYDADAALVPGKMFDTPDDAVELIVCDTTAVEENGPQKEDDLARYAQEQNSFAVNADAADREELGKRSIEAKIIVSRIKELTGDEPQMLFDETLNGGAGGYRRAQYRDMVILLRSANVAGPEYAKALNDAGIPAVCSTAYGYFSTYEIAQVLNILKVIDNPRQDIALAGALRSYFCYLTAQELAYVKACSPKSDLYTAVLEYIQNAESGNYDEVLAAKLSKFLDFIGEYRKKAAFTPIHELIKSIVYNTGYIVYAASKENGKRRMANLDILVDKAAEFERTSFHGLFNFLRYIDKIQKYEIDMGEADTLSENDDVVRIMSIHKSKGLEFPIVFVADMEKKYNLRDLSERVGFHVDYGIGTDMVDVASRVRKKSFHKRAMAESMKINAIGEELRILYVALTRAVEKLILVGAVKDAGSSTAGWRARAQSHGGDYGYVYDSTNYLDLAAPAFFKSGTAKTSVVVVENIDKLYSCDTAFEAVDENKEAQVENEKLENEFRRRFNFKYANEAAVHLPGKFSVSELKHEAIDEADNEAVRLVSVKADKPVMNLEDSEERNPGAERGNAYHKVFELLDYGVSPDYGSMKAFIHSLVLDKKMDVEYEELVNPNKLVVFLKTGLGKRMKDAALSGKMYRERQFITGFPAETLKSEYSGCRDIILVQGIIDCCFEEDGEMVIVDYKTDKVDEENAENILKARYSEQLKLYARAVEQISRVKVKECTIYSVSVNREIKL